MIKRKSIYLTIISFLLLIGMIDVFTLDYASNESYYRSLCNQTTISGSDKETCRGYFEYLSQKASDSQKDIDKYKGEISKYKDDLAKQVEIANDYEAKIEDFNGEITTLDASIARLISNIEKIEAEIEIREAEIFEKDRIIIERMRKTQSDMRFGYEIDFLIKAKDFSTLIASASVVSDIMEFEAIQIEEINRLIEKQREDQDTLVLQRETIEVNKQEIQNKKAQVEVLKAEVDVAIANYKRTMAELEALQSQAYADANAIRKQMENISAALEEVVSSTGFVRPIVGGYISAKVWSYPPPWSATHIGYDYASSMGTPIRAAANGVVIFSSDNCPSTGYLGNWCGSPGMNGGGNQVHLLVSVNNQLYGLMYFHMQSGTPIKAGQTVVGGQRIGAIGSSGNSTGPHVHVEVIYLGSRTINDYLASWNGNLAHNIGMNLSNRCIDKGNAAPCRLDPGVVFGGS